MAKQLLLRQLESNCIEMVKIIAKDDTYELRLRKCYTHSRVDQTV